MPIVKLIDEEWCFRSLQDTQNWIILGCSQYDDGKQIFKFFF